ncbi:MAG: ATP-grasp domain-containing protein, partial [Bacteroidota bacterium]|nr:ATP-grasp domain-containing protein [Bacteroidota bacterium]
MKVCVLQPDYTTTDVDYKDYDPPRDLFPLLPGDIVDNVFLNKLSTYRQLKELRKNNYDIFVNLCEGYLEWSVPSIDVIYSLDMLNLPYTGPTALLYDPPKELMKYVAYTCGVPTPPYVLVKNINQVDEVVSKLSFPLFIKPAKAGDSLGIDGDSLVTDRHGLEKKLSDILQDYQEILVEKYIPGREFTVLVAAEVDGKNCKVYNPLEFVFPEGKKFKTYSLKTSELHEECNIPCKEDNISARLKDSAAKIFTAFNGVGYARLDFRLNDNNELFFLEINFTCSVFYDKGYEGSADYILMHEPEGKKGFLRKIINEGIARHVRNQKKYIVKGDALSGYGMYAVKGLHEGEVIYTGEERPHRLVTKKYVEQNWNVDELQSFRKYAWPVSSEVYILWDNAPAEWSPQNHSCDPNTEYAGLNVIAIKNIVMGEELTLDYTTFLNNEMESFICNCGAENCKRVIQGIQANSITHREMKRCDGLK